MGRRGVYDTGSRTCEVICRCGKRLFSFSAWDQHLREKHPELRREMRKNGDLEEDRLEFRKVREPEGG